MEIFLAVKTIGTEDQDFKNIPCIVSLNDFSDDVITQSSVAQGNMGICSSLCFSS